MKNELARYCIAEDIAEGLICLDGNGFVHRVIKPENILLRIKDNSLVCRAKFCDFGASKEIRTTSYQRSLTVNAHKQHILIFAPPEEFKDGKTSSDYDMWGFGLILCCLVGNESLQLRAKPGTLPYLADNGKLVGMIKEWYNQSGTTIYAIVQISGQAKIGR